MKYSKLTLAVLMGLGVSACGGGGSGSGDSGNNSTPATDRSYAVSAFVQDAEGNAISDALVCYDSNNSQTCDNGEIMAYSGNEGKVTLEVKDSQFNAQTNVIAVKNENVYSVIPSADEVIPQATNVVAMAAYLNPVNTFITKYAKDSGVSFNEAKRSISQNLGIDASKLGGNIKNAPESFVAFAQSASSLNVAVTQDNIGDFKETYQNIDTVMKEEQVELQIIINIIINKNSLDIDKNDIERNELPTGSFDATLSGCRGYKFTSNVTDPDGDSLTYLWDFGDKETSTEQNPVHIYASAGTYKVKLTVKDKIGRLVVDKTLNVDSTNCESVVVTPNFSFVQDSSIKGLVKFTNQSTGNVKALLWDFGDGTSSKEFNPTHTYSQSGTYDVILTVIDADGNTIESDPSSIVIDLSDVTVNHAPKADFTLSVNKLNIKATNNSSDEDNDKLSYSWILSDGFTSNSKNLDHTFAKDGTYKVTLVVSDGKTQSTKDDSVTVASDSLSASIKVLSNQNRKVSLSAQVEGADSDVSYKWVMGDGTTKTGKSVEYTYTKDGQYTVELTVSTSDKTVTTKEIVNISSDNNAPKAAFKSTVNGKSVSFANQSTDSDNDTLTYAWDFGDGSKSTAKNPSHTYAQDGKTYSVKLTVSDGKLTDESTQSVDIPKVDITGNHAPTVLFRYSFTGLSGTFSVQAKDQDKDPLTYTWDFGDGLTSTEKNAKVTYKQGGKKTISLTVSDGKTSTTKTHEVTLDNVEMVSPTKNGLYVKTDLTTVYGWTDDKATLFGAWPGQSLAKSEADGWMFVDTSAITQSKINVIFSNGGQNQTTDIIGIAPKGCLVDSTVTPLDQCSLSNVELKTVEGGDDFPEPGSTITVNDEGVKFGQLDYGSFTSSSDVFVESAPYVMTNLAPGSYHETKTVTLSLQDADSNEADGKIYYTLDNTVPTEDSTLYTGPITLEDNSSDGLGTAYRLRTLVVGDNGMKQEQHFFWFIKNNATPAPATDFRDETIYFVVTARYFDGDADNNYYCRDRFDAEDPSWRGDFKGLIEKLDYIKDLGFTAIWVTPPVENRSGLDYHGYHAYDWFQPDLRLESPGYTYFDFIKAAHKKGIKVVQDVVLNHSSNYGIRGQAYIEKIPTKYYIDKKFGKDGVNYGPYKKNIGDYVSYNRCDNDNYVAPAWHRRLCAGDPEAKAEFTVKFKQGSVSVNNTSSVGIDNRYFWSPAVQNYLPEKWYHVAYTNNWESVEEVQQRSMAGDCVDLKTESDNVKAYMNSAMKMYIDMGIDAVRIDTLKHMPREDVMGMTKVWQEYKPNMFVFGEALIKGFGDNTPSELHPWYYTRTSEASAAKSGDSGISVLDFSLMSTFRNNVTRGNLGGLSDVFNQFDNDYADASKLVTFFQNHDLTPDNTWSGSGAQHCCSDRVNSALAYNVLWTVRGIPVMYAGDERGVRIGLPPDLTNSDDLVKDTGRIYVGDSFDDATANSDPIIGHIKDLNAIRKTSKALQRGKLKVIDGGELTFERVYENERAIVALVGAGGGSVTVKGASTDGSYTDVVTGTKYTVSGGSVNLGNIPGGSMRVLVKDYAGGKVTGNSSFLK